MQACEAWREVWELVEPQLGPEIRSCSAADVCMPPGEPFSSWVQDYIAELHHAAPARPQLARDGIRVCQKLIDQFTEDDELTQMNTRTDLAEFLRFDGDTEASERVLLDLIAQYPTRRRGECTWPRA